MDPEDNDDPEITALRETWEEVGVPISQQEVLIAGTSIYIPPSNYRVYPYLAFAKARPTFTLQVSEVQSILEVPIASLLDDTSVTKKTLKTSYLESTEVPCFILNDTIVWGATAMILMEFKELFTKALQD
jgi:hypothetical protein